MSPFVFYCCRLLPSTDLHTSWDVPLNNVLTFSLGNKWYRTLVVCYTTKGAHILTQAANHKLHFLLCHLIKQLSKKQARFRLMGHFSRIKKAWSGAVFLGFHGVIFNLSIFPLNTSRKFLPFSRFWVLTRVTPYKNICIVSLCFAGPSYTFKDMNCVTDPPQNLWGWDLLWHNRSFISSDYLSMSWT